MKRFLFFLLPFSLYLFPSAVFASGEFSTAFRSTYTVTKDAETIVSHQIKLTNQQANTFASEYSLTIGSTTVSSIKVTDGTGSLPFTSETSENSTTVNAKLSERPVVGIGGTKTFTIQYRDQDIASSVGKILEVNIPRIAQSKDFDTLETILIVPDNFGKPTTIFPNPTSQTKEGSSYRITFQQNNDTGISAVFGSSQLFHIALTYSLENKGLASTMESITLIPDTSYQRMNYDRIDPKPASVTRDEDGNWIATYKIEGKEKLHIAVSATAELFMSPTISIEEQHPENYLSSNQYWQSENPEIVQLAKTLRTPQAIYDYVVSHLSYDYSKIESDPTRLGGRVALANASKAICTEFTDLFISLARAAGIPSRELNGFAYTQNPKLRPLSLKRDILHSWPEYWDENKKIWIPVDPTWGNTTGGIDYFTKLDFNHIVFAIHGFSPTSPLSAGFFKTGDQEGKTIFVDPATSIESGLGQQIAVHISGPKRIPSLFGSSATLEVENNGQQAVYNIPVVVTSAPGLRVMGISPNIPYLLPGQALNRTMSIRPKMAFLNQKAPIVVTVGEQQSRYEPIITSPIISFQVGAVFFSVAGVISLVIAKRTGNLHLPRRS